MFALGGRLVMQGYDGDKAKILARLRRVEGQVHAVAQLTQISAATSALKAVSVMLVDDHLNHCVRQAAAEGGEVADEKLSEVEKVISRLVRS